MTVLAGVADVAPDYTLSPYTGWVRAHWVALAKQLLATARRHGSENHARIRFPGPAGAYGEAVDGLEGFARTLLAAGFLAVGSGFSDTTDLDWYAPGFDTGPDPTQTADERWVRPSEHSQAKVEACSLALVLHLTRPYLWARFASRTQEMLVDYLAEWIHAAYPKNNWVWFRLIVQQFLRSVGGPWSPDDLEEDLAFNESCYCGDGWYRDGAERTFDYYSGWVFSVYPLLWCDMLPDDPATQALRPVYQSRLDDYLSAATALIGADGAMVAQGRSLIYRFAQAASIWMGAYSGSEAVTPGLVRRATSGLVANFVHHHAPDAAGVLTPGWYAPWPRLAQAYSGTGSPYWACKGLLGLALPPTHPVWTAVEQPLPVETGDICRALPQPGWLLTSSDGIVRILNHGSDHALVGGESADSPLYARLGYSTATFPLLDERAWTSPLDQSVTLVDVQGHASHRTGFESLAVFTADGVAVGASRAAAHWVDPAPNQKRHGAGYTGDATAAGEVTIVSLARLGWEMRAVRLARTSARILRIGGWAVTGNQVVTSTAGPAGLIVAAAETDTLASRVESACAGEGGVEFRGDASPLGPGTAVPYLDLLPRTGAWMAALVTLISPGHPEENARWKADITPAGSGVRVRITWPDAVRTDTHVPLAPSPRRKIKEKE